MGLARAVLRTRRARVALALLALLCVASLASLAAGEATTVSGRALAGAPLALAACAAVGAGGFVVGIAFGALAGYRRGFFDDGFFRLAEVVDTFPTVVLVPLAQALVVGWEGSTLVGLTALLRAASVSRLVRAQITRSRTDDVVFAAQALGFGPVAVLVRHLGRRVLGFAAANAAFGVASVVGLEAALAFLGLPVRPRSWGALLAEGLRTGASDATALALGCTALTALALALLADAIRCEAG